MGQAGAPPIAANAANAAAAFSSLSVPLLSSTHLPPPCFSLPHHTHKPQATLSPLRSSPPSRAARAAFPGSSKGRGGARRCFRGAARAFERSRDECFYFLSRPPKPCLAPRAVLELLGLDPSCKRQNRRCEDCSSCRVIEKKRWCVVAFFFPRRFLFSLAAARGVDVGPADGTGLAARSSQERERSPLPSSHPLTSNKTARSTDPFHAQTRANQKRTENTKQSRKRASPSSLSTQDCRPSFAPRSTVGSSLVQGCQHTQPWRRRRRTR
jgi:hypothetical protein